MERKDIFEKLNNINVNDKIKTKIGLKYLSWAYAWELLKKEFPNAEYKIYTHSVEQTETKTIKSENGDTITTQSSTTVDLPYFTDGRTCFVKVGVTIEGFEETEILPVMDAKNQAVPVSMVTMTAVNKAIQRAFVKACARHGLGLYVYAGEDLPESERKVIDYKALAATADRLALVKLSEEGFNQMKDGVINFLQGESTSMPEDAQTAITNFILKHAEGKRLSAFDFKADNEKLQHIYNFINAVKKELAAPVNG